MLLEFTEVKDAFIVSPELLGATDTVDSVSEITAEKQTSLTSEHIPAQKMSRLSFL